MTTPLSTRTPQDIDTELANLARTLARAEHNVSAAFEGLHYAIGERPSRKRGAPKWGTTHAQAVATALTMPADTTYGGVTASLAALKNTRSVLRSVQEEIAPLDAEYDRRPWSRFFLVQNTGGHIHRTMSCATCYPTTSFGWLPDLSGMTEADAVAAHGPLLCSVCYPSAPVEWTLGKPKSPRCDGAGRDADRSTVTRHGMRVYGDCRECGVRGQLTPNGFVRAHKPPEK
jgi:hypothetical protein